MADTKNPSKIWRMVTSEQKYSKSVRRIAGYAQLSLSVRSILRARLTYKRAWTDDEVQAHVAANKGAQFDPAITRIALGTMERETR
ncbi:MAG: hypothetical protein ACYCVB_10990 [Bacilli bacterium]